MKASVITDKLKEYPLAVICVVVIAVCVVVIFLRGGVAAELSAKEAKLDSRIQTINKNVENAKDLEQDTEDLATIVDKVHSLLFERYERAININFFYEFEEKADVVISNISQLPQSDPIYSDGGPRQLELHSTLVFNLTMSGSFPDVLGLLYEINRADPVIRVADFQVNRNNSGVIDGNIDARLRVLVLANNDD